MSKKSKKHAKNDNNKRDITEDTAGGTNDNFIVKDLKNGVNNHDDKNTRTTQVLQH